MAGMSKSKKSSKKDASIEDQEIQDQDLGPSGVYLPGMPLAEDEQLEVDLSAYVMLHTMKADWPCLSFDNYYDPSMSDEQTSFPITGFLVTGTQTDNVTSNSLYLVRYANMHKNQVERDGDGDEIESDDDDDEEAIAKKEPRQHVVSINHPGSVNRVRQGARFTATWSDAGFVSIWDLSDSFCELSSMDVTAPSTIIRRPHIASLHSTMETAAVHQSEGFALAWSAGNTSAAASQLLAGDCLGHISLTEMASGAGFITQSSTFHNHSGSVEDLQWSPSEATVFASCSTDGTVAIWDVRMPRDRCALKQAVHPSLDHSVDINVLSWSPRSTHLLATGSDDGHFAVWDLRSWKPTQQPSFAPYGGGLMYESRWHRDAITSIEWSPHDANVLAVSGADDQITLWDFGLQSEESNAKDEDLEQVPDQLLFVHQGQEQIKEVHWHRQYSGLLISTALSGFNIFKTISV